MDRNLVTSSGITAEIDMALAIVAEDHGKELALEVAKVLLVVGHSKPSPRDAVFAVLAICARCSASVSE